MIGGMQSIVETLGRVLDASLHLLQERLEHLARRSLQQPLGLLGILLVQGFASEELGDLVGEHVAVMVDQVVLLGNVLVVHLLQVVLENILRDLGLADGDLLDGFSVGGGFGGHVADAASKEILASVDDDGGVVDGIDLLSDHHHAHALGHAPGDVVDQQGDFLCHLFKKVVNYKKRVGCSLIYFSGSSYRMKPGQSKNIQEAKKRNIEIINNLKQTLGKPTIVEAQRTLKILQKIIERISISLNLDSDFILKFNEYGNSQKLKLNKALIQELSPPVLDLILKEAKLEQEFKGLAVIEQQLRQNQNVEEDKVQEYTRIRKDMEYNFRSLVRALQKNSNDIEILKSLKSNSAVNFQGSSIYESLSNYKIIMQKMLATAAEEEDSHAQMIKDLETKIESLEKTKTNCEAELIHLRQERARHTEEKKEEIDKLKSQIREVKNYKEKEIEKISKENKTLYDSLIKDHKTREEKLKAEINTEKGKLQKLRDQNGKSQTKYKNEKTTNEAQLVDLINTYDKEMFTSSQAKTDAQKELKRVSDELNNLKRHFSEIEEERKREDQILEADRQRKEKWEWMEKRKGEAATRIKEAFRLWKTKNKKKKKKNKK